MDLHGLLGDPPGGGGGGGGGGEGEGGQGKVVGGRRDVGCRGISDEVKGICWGLLGYTK